MDVNQPDDDGNTCLHAWASWKCSRPPDSHRTILSLLLGHGIDVHSQNAEGHTALHIVAALGRKKAAQALTRMPWTHPSSTPSCSCPIKLATQPCTSLHPRAEKESSRTCVGNLDLLMRRSGRSFLHCAAKGIHTSTKVFELLLDSESLQRMSSTKKISLTRACVFALDRLHGGDWHYSLFSARRDSGIAMPNFCSAIEKLSNSKGNIPESEDGQTTPLHTLCEIIARNGFSYHIDSGIECEICDAYRSCLHALLKRTGNVTSRDQSGRTSMDILLTRIYLISEYAPHTIEFNHVAIDSLVTILERCGPSDIKTPLLGQEVCARCRRPWRRTSH